MVRITTRMIAFCLLAMLPSCGRSPLGMFATFDEARSGAGPDYVSAVYSKADNLYYPEQSAAELQDGDIYGFLVWLDEARTQLGSESVTFDARLGTYGAFRPSGNFIITGNRVNLIREDLLKAQLSVQIRGAFGEGANWEGDEQVEVDDSVPVEVDVAEPSEPSEPAEPSEPSQPT